MLFQFFYHLQKRQDFINIIHQSIVIKSCISQKRIIDILQKPAHQFTVYPKLLHFDPNHPENHNLKMTRKDAREGFIQIKTDKTTNRTLECKKKDNKFQDIINVLQSYYDDYGEALSN